MRFKFHMDLSDLVGHKSCQRYQDEAVLVRGL